MTSEPPALAGIISAMNSAEFDFELGDVEEYNRELSERSLHDFIRQMWRYIDPNPFRDNWHIGVMCEHLEAVTAGQIHRLIINVPPRHQKSITVSVAWPAWTWLQTAGKDEHGDITTPLKGPHVQFLFASYAQNLSVRDSKKCRDLIESPLYQRRWGDQFHLTSDQNTKIRFENSAKGYRLATSVDGQLTGEGGAIIGIDDPISTKEALSEPVREGCIEWWDTAMSNRLNDQQTGAYVVIMQRSHQRDLTGHLLEQGGWVHLCLPARFEPDHPYVYGKDPRFKPDEADKGEGALLCESRFPEDALDRLETDMGSYNVAGQLQQRPAPRSGGMFDRDWWQRCTLKEVPFGGKTVRGWDLAGTEEIEGKTSRPAWSASVKIKRVNGAFYILNVHRFRGSPLKVEKTIRATAEADGESVLTDVPQDPGQAGKSQVRHIVRQNAGFNVRYTTESGSKVQRAEALSAQVEAHNVYLVEGPWNEKFIEEAELFPNGDYSDQIDAASRAFHRLVGRKDRRVGTVGPVVITAESA